MLCIVGGGGVLVWHGWVRVSNHLKQHSEAGRLLSEHVIIPILMGAPPPEAKKAEASMHKEEENGKKQGMGR